MTLQRVIATTSRRRGRRAKHQSRLAVDVNTFLTEAG
jgi:hypothetical protein